MAAGRFGYVSIHRGSVVRFQPRKTYLVVARPRPPPQSVSPSTLQLCSAPWLDWTATGSVDTTLSQLHLLLELYRTDVADGRVTSAAEPLDVFEHVGLGVGVGAV